MTIELPVAEGRRVRRAFFSLLGAERRRVITGVVLHVAAAGASTAAPLLMGRMIDDLSAGASVGDIDRLALGLAAALLAALILTWAAGYTLNQIGELLSVRLRERFIDRCLRLPPHVAEQAGSGDLTTRSTVDVPEAGSLLRDTAPWVTTAILTSLVYIGAMAWTSPVLALTVLLAAPSISIGARWYLKRARSGYIDERRAESRMGETLAASSDGARTAELFELTRHRRRTGDEAIAAHWGATRYTLFLRSVYFLGLESSYVLPTAGVLLVGAVLYFDGAVSLGAVSACAVLSRQAMAPLNNLLMTIERVQRGLASLARVEGVGQTESDEPVQSGRAPTGGDVVLRDVRFTYPTGGEVLHGVDLAVPAGERLAVVGPSGAGKSTLARLIAGIDPPGSGSVALGGVDVASMPLEVRRRHVTLVTQEHHVFTATLRENLALAERDATDAELRDALATVGATWADDLDVELGGTARELDAASAQQIALARIILADPDVVILDEATAMLDPRAARDTERALAAVLEGRTVIGIAHRLHTAHDADRIAVVDGGEVAELGSHEELLARDGAYARLWQSWHGTAESSAT
ncbi:ABC transporter ATP-binding protein/permease [Glycomyces sp. L485]|uniref:ABC transporter ATP-binding protein n=1 Tax=Glycomyces sp. L485 TaxID=2909235 RepID=UPI001F4B1FB8|nr:ABC transporter ATP-binding protein [Glycomyces sp. L485]MCH7230993.1 ABC transporter ATP-binding protein/permease [Glycomyces sp. L485]